MIRVFARVYAEMPSPRATLALSGQCAEESLVFLPVRDVLGRNRMARTRSSLMVPAFALALLSGCTRVHSLDVSRFNTSALNNGAADTILGDASTVLQTNDG